MNIYLVGGAVRDQLLGFPIKEKDWVVVGANADCLLQKGFKPVGKDFPVFLHPETKEEYALARTERKSGRGYTGFIFDVSPTVSLEEDLKRRDLTINAMAQTTDGKLIDPYQGKADLEHKLLKHVSDAFSEDPVRILRVARFAARFAHLGFKVAKETLALMKKMVEAGEIDVLTKERVWKELERALGENNPDVFFKCLSSCDALEKLFPAIRLNSEGMHALERSLIEAADTRIRFAVLLHDLSQKEIQDFCSRYGMPRDYAWLAKATAMHLETYKRALKLDAICLLQFLESTDAFRREERFKNLLKTLALSSDSSHSLFLLNAFNTAKAVNVHLFLKEFKGKEIAEKLKKERIHALQIQLQLFKKYE